MEPFTTTNTLPLSIAQVASTVYGEAEPASAPAQTATAVLPAVHEQLLAAVVTRVGEVEAAEWALDQAKAARDVQLAAALSSGVPTDRVAAAAGVPESALAGFALGGEAVPTDG
ncbi:MAG: hypothetical protein JWO49_2699 [Arthrobacter sp.]|nr:hypothetical protein [Arthrobacter sp.]